jgi:hypothetical protein
LFSAGRFVASSVVTDFTGATYGDKVAFGGLEWISALDIVDAGAGEIA